MRPLGLGGPRQLPSLPILKAGHEECTSSLNVSYTYIMYLNVMMYNFHKVNKWYNNYNLKYFAGNQLPKTTSFICSPQAIVYQLIRHSLQCINYRFKKIYFTIVSSVCIIILFCIEYLTQIYLLGFAPFLLLSFACAI